jgi:riboflavin kinase/FMN adenylyltransferase
MLFKGGGEDRLKIIRGADIRNAPTEGCVVAVGYFDGVHVGHQRVFDVAVRQAEDLGVQAALLTFSDHPLKTLRPDLAPHPLMLLEDRLALAGKWGFEKAFVLDFDADLASMPPGIFTDRILIGALGAAGIVAGSGWRFGKERSGDMDFLRGPAREKGLRVWAVQPVRREGKNVSSTRIRDLLAQGDVTAARDILGRPHFVRGVVRKGRGRGKGLGFPTVNLDTGDIMLPAAGVYAGAYLLPDRRGPAAVNVGPSPTFEDSIPGVEAHLLQWKGDLYGDPVTIVFLERLRDERTYDNDEALSRQIAADVNRSLKLFSRSAVEGIIL